MFYFEFDYNTLLINFTPLNSLKIQPDLFEQKIQKKKEPKIDFKNTKKQNKQTKN